MRIVRYLNEPGEACWGRLGPGGDVFALTGDAFAAHSFAQKPEEAHRRLAPLSPPTIWAIGRNYRDHAKEMKAEAELAEPVVFLKATTAVIGPDEPIILPRSAPDEVDFEAELAVVIGRTARDVPPARALDHVWGYTCANDVTARDCQKRRDQQWARAKSFDSFCPLGPEVVTADEIDPGRLAIRSLLNGRVMQESNTQQMIFSVPRLISFLSRQFTLLPGSVILTGTPAGVGAGRTPPVYLRPGDEVRVEIEGIGCLRSPVRAAVDEGPPGPPPRSARG